MKRQLGSPPPSRTFDWFMAFSVTLMVAGLFQDGWAHSHGMVDQSFFTPWHAILYGTMALNGLVLLACGLMNLRGGYSFRNGLPYGYWVSAIGVATFLLGGVLDLAWHTLFGIEEDLNALISPTHLLLAVAAALVASGPLRSVANQVEPGGPARWSRVGPAVLATTAILSLLAFFSQYVNPIGSGDVAKIIANSNRKPVVANIYAMRPDGTQQTRLTMNTATDDLSVAGSPDGKWIAYRTSVVPSEEEIFIARSDGSAPGQVTQMHRWATQPSWSPDGQHLAFVSAPAGTSGSYRLMTIARNGAGARMLVETVAQITAPAWTPDGSRIAYSTRNGLSTELAMVSAAGGTPQFVAGTKGASYPSFSANGKWLAFALSSGERSDVYVALPVGSNPHPFVRDATMPAFSPDSDALTYVSSGNGASDIGVVRMGHGSGVNVSRFSGIIATRPMWMSGGRIVYGAYANDSIFNTDVALALSVGAFLISTILLMGAILVLLRRFALPFGAITVLILIYAALSSTQHDCYPAIAAAFVSGILGDVVAALAGERLRIGVPFHAFAFGFSATFAALFIVVVDVYFGHLGWSPNTVFGTSLLAGFSGLLVSFCCTSPLPQPAAQLRTERTSA